MTERIVFFILNWVLTKLWSLGATALKKHQCEKKLREHQQAVKDVKENPTKENKVKMQSTARELARDAYYRRVRKRTEG